MAKLKKAKSKADFEKKRKGKMNKIEFVGQEIKVWPNQEGVGIPTRYFSIPELLNKLDNDITDAKELKIFIERKDKK